MQNLVKIYHAVKELWAGSNDAQPITKGCNTCQVLDNVNMHLYAKFDQIILRCPRVMSILLNDHRQTDILTK